MSIIREMLAMAVAGGYAGVAGAKRVDPKRLKTGVVLIGVTLPLYSFAKGVWRSRPHPIPRNLRSRPTFRIDIRYVVYQTPDTV